MESSEDVERLSKAIEKLLAEKRGRDAAGETFFEDDEDQLLLSRLLSQLESQKESEILKNPEGPTQEESMDSSVFVEKAQDISERRRQSDNQKEERSAEGIEKEIEEELNMRGPTQEESMDSSVSIDKAQDNSERRCQSEDQKEEPSAGDTEKEIKELNMQRPTYEESMNSSISIDKAEDKSERPDQSKDLKGEVSAEDMAKEIKELKRQNTITHVLLSAMIVLTLTWQLSEFSVILTVKDKLSHPFRSFGGILGGMLKRKASQANDQFQEKHRESSREQNHHNESTSLPPLKVPDMLREMGLNDEE